MLSHVLLYVDVGSVPASELANQARLGIVFCSYSVYLPVTGKNAAAFKCLTFFLWKGVASPDNSFSLAR